MTNVVRTGMYLLLLIVIVSASGLLGWWSRRRAWTETTGWRRIPEALRPADHATDPGEPWIRWLGHSGFVLRWHGQTMLLDPNLGGHCTVSRRVMELPPLLAGIGPVSVLISHAHFDHLHVDTLAGLEELAAVFIPDGSEVFLERLSGGGTTIVPVRKDREYRIGSLRVTPVRAAHNGNRFHPLRSSFGAVGYMISAPDGTTVYYAGDTAFDNGWDDLRERFHPDLAILPIGAYAPRIPLKHHHLNPEEAARVASILGVDRVIPCHFGTFTLSFDRPAAALPRFAAAAKRENITWSMPVVLDRGGVTDLANMVRDAAPAPPRLAATAGEPGDSTP